MTRKPAVGLRLRVVDERLLRGCSAGLNQRTAIVTIGVEGVPGEPAFGRVAAGAAMLCPEQPLFGVGPSDWPGAFVMDTPAPGATAEWLLGQWIVALAVALQRWARDPAWRGRVIGSEPGLIRLAIPWHRPGVMTDTLRLALRLVERWAGPSDSPPEDLNAAIRPGMQEAREGALAPAGFRAALAGLSRGIPVNVRLGMVSFGWGAAAVTMADNFTAATPFVATALAQDKSYTNRLLGEAGLPVPRAEVVATFEEAVRAAVAVGWPVVVKPADQEQGRAVTPGIGDEVALHHAFDRATRLSPGRVLVEQHVEGDDHRLLVVNGRLLAAARRIPGGVVGDGVATVPKLVELVNADPRRGSDAHSLMKRLVLDSEALDVLADQGVPVESIPAAGRWVAVRRTANISTGGTAVDVTGGVHPDNRLLAERAARLVGLDIAGVDIVTADIGRSWREVGAAICEINAQPGLRPHWLGDPGRDLGGEIVEHLLEGRSGRIPTAAITGTNGKGTTALMLHHIWSSMGRVAGVCTTQEVRIGGDVVSTDNLSGYPGGRIILTDPATEVAIIELPRKGLIYFGHPCDSYDVAALLNVQDDHLGSDGIRTLQQMAELKAEVLARARQAVVVNADDPLCLAMLARAGTDRHILVTTDPAAGPVAAHLAGGGEAVFLADHDGARWIVLAAAAGRIPLMPVAGMPAARGGLLRFNVSNAMFAAALAWAQGVGPIRIRRALASFAGSATQNPGRYNFLDGFGFEVLLDYAHNPDGVRELCRVASELPVQGRRIVCNLHVGNRHRSHLIEVAPVLAATFEDFVLGCYAEELSEEYALADVDPAAAMTGLSAQLLAAAGVAESRMTTVLDPLEAIRTTLSMGRPGDLVVLMAAPEEALPVAESLRGSLGPVASTR